MLDYIFILAICGAAIYTFTRLQKSHPVDDNDTNDTEISHSRNLECTDSDSDALEEITNRHKQEECLKVTLTAAPHSKLGRKELMSLRAGAPLWLEHSDFSGIERVKVYSGGYMVGELLLTDAERVISVMEVSHITGTYVCRRNSGLHGEIDMMLAVYHEPKTKSELQSITQSQWINALRSPYKLRVSIPGEKYIFQN